MSIIVEWTGVVREVKSDNDLCIVIIDFPVLIVLPKQEAIKLKRNQKITYSGTISKIKYSLKQKSLMNIKYIKIESVTLTNVKIIELGNIYN